MRRLIGQQVRLLSLRCGSPKASMWQRHRPRAAARPFNGGVELSGLTLRPEHPLPFGGDVVLPLPHEALLMRLEVGDALPDQLALGL
jgi:hypothetical protein